MIHIASDASAAGGIKMMLRKIGLEQTESVYEFWEMFSVGPVWRLHDKDGQQERFDWKKENITDEWQEQQDEYEIFGKAVNRIKSLPDGETAIIWASENAHEQTGLRFVMHLFKGKAMDFIVINASRLLGEMYEGAKIRHGVLHTGEITEEKLRLIYEQSATIPPLTDHEREAYEKEWLELSSSQENLRLWRNGAIHNVREDYCDGFIVKQAKKLQRQRGTEEFMKSARLIGEVIGNLEQVVGDQFVEYRLRQLIRKGVFLAEGHLTAMAFYEVKLNGERKHED